MTELQKILCATEGLHLPAQEAALATLVRISGSSYRQPGARMVVSSDGRWTGAISGGCLEGDVLLRAQRIIQQGKPTVVRYDTTNDDANVFGVGLGCNGIIDILIEPFSTLEAPCIQSLQALRSPASPLIHALIFHSTDSSLPLGERWILEGSSSAPSAMPLALYDDCMSILRTGVSAHRSYTTPAGEIEVFIEVVQPQIRCIIFGAGYDAFPTVYFASHLGWHVTVTDKSPAKAQASHFPLADTVVCLPPHSVTQHLSFDKHTVCLFMTHNFLYDLEVVPQLLASDVPYIGILGPRKRWQKMQEEFCKQGIVLHERDVQRIYSPVGLDLGAETPEEIALSVIAEVQSVLHKGKGMSLRDKSGRIHEERVVSSL